MFIFSLLFIALAAFACNNIVCSTYIHDLIYKRSQSHSLAAAPHGCPLTIDRQMQILRFYLNETLSGFNHFNFFWPANLMSREWDVDLLNNGNEDTVDPVLAVETAQECDLKRRQMFQTDPVWEQSLCPWHWRVHRDPDRIPSILPQAVCKCDRVVSKGGNNLLSSTNGYECEPVHMAVKVVRFSGGTCSNPKEEIEQVPVACVAIARHVHPVAHGGKFQDHIIPDTEI